MPPVKEAESSASRGRSPEQPLRNVNRLWSGRRPQSASAYEHRTPRLPVGGGSERKGTNRIHKMGAIEQSKLFKIWSGFAAGGRRR